MKTWQCDEIAHFLVTAVVASSSFRLLVLVLLPQLSEKLELQIHTTRPGLDLHSFLYFSAHTTQSNSLAIDKLVVVQKGSIK